MRTEELVTFSLGTNLGDRESNIRTAIECMQKAFGVAPEAVSPVMETEAVGFEGPAFLNCVARFRTSESPISVLRICKRIEKEMGRCDEPEYDGEGRRIYHDRIIDIDILFYGDKVINTDRLVIPHPQVETRPFVRDLLDLCKN